MKINGKTTYIDCDGDLRLSPTFEDIIYSGRPCMIAGDNHKYGIVIGEQIIIPFIYDHINEAVTNNFFDNKITYNGENVQVFITTLDSKYGFECIHQFNQHLIGHSDCKYENIFFMPFRRGNSFIKIQSNRKLGVADLTGTIVVPCDFEEISLCSGSVGKCILGFYTKNKFGWGLIGYNCDMIIPNGYDEIREYWPNGRSISVGTKNNINIIHDSATGTIIDVQSGDFDLGTSSIEEWYNK